jgi:ATP-dependent DNA helicase RecQ
MPDITLIKIIVPTIFLLGIISMVIFFTLSEKLSLQLAGQLYSFSTGWLVAFLYLFIGVLLIDFFRLSNHIFHFIDNGTVYRIFTNNTTTSLIVLGVVSLILAYGNLLYHNKKRQHINIESDKISEPVKIVGISDLHIGYTISAKEVDKWVELINSEKPDVRIVVHMDLPNSPEEYFQEAGRAGRDGKKSYSVILYTKSDSVKLKKRISDTFPEKELIVRVYEALGNYFQVAVGSGAGRAFDFDLIEFCSRFKLPSLQTHHALKILELAGYLEYTDEIDARSKLRFLIYRDDMYFLRLEPITDELLHTIMRSYTGVFSDDIYIDESMLASRIGKTRQEVYDILVNLSKLRYISYVPAKKTPFIIYTSSREDIKFITIPQSVYEERKKRFSKRIHSIIDYAENSDVCRSRMLLVYFGETNSKDCGCCDVCLRKNESGLSNWEYRLIGEKLEEAFKSQTTYRLNELVDSISESETLAISSSETTSFSKQGENNDKIIKVIRFKIDSGELILEDDRISKGKRL